jgi:hypothetical protein
MATTTNITMSTTTTMTITTAAAVVATTTDMSILLLLLPCQYYYYYYYYYYNHHHHHHHHNFKVCKAVLWSKTSQNSLVNAELVEPRTFLQMLHKSYWRKHAPRTIVKNYENWLLMSYQNSHEIIFEWLSIVVNYTSKYTYQVQTSCPSRHS